MMDYQCNLKDGLGSDELSGRLNVGRIGTNDKTFFIADGYMFNVPKKIENDAKKLHIDENSKSRWYIADVNVTNNGTEIQDPMRSTSSVASELNDCAISILYHMDDIANYLEQFRNIINSISILNRNFLEIEVLKPIYAAISIVGLHILKPFHELILDYGTKYSTLMNSFPKLYNELISTSPSDMLTLNQVFYFASPDHFKDALPNAALTKSLMEVAQEYLRKLSQLLSLLLKKFSQGFVYQKGAIFGFGERKYEDTGTVLKICDLNEEKIYQLDSVQIHNLGEERSVGFANYELDIRGKQNLESVSRKMVLNKSADLTKNLRDLRKYRKPTAEIKELKLEWNKKMKKLEESGFSQKEIANTNVERQKLNDLDFLGKQILPAREQGEEQTNVYRSSISKEQLSVSQGRSCCIPFKA